MTELRIDRVESPIGTLALAVHGDALCALSFCDRGDRDGEQGLRARLATRFGELALRESDDPAGHSSRLRAYLGGRLDALDEIPVDAGGTPFQQRVWQALRSVRAGETRSYGDIARAVGSPGATRAVGSANHRNPIALVIPCHRIVNADRRLGGYGGGIDRKRWLLEHERALLLA